MSDIRGISKIEKKETVNRNKNVIINQMKCQETYFQSKKSSRKIKVIEILIILI